MLKRLYRETTETGQTDWQSKRNRALGGVKNYMGNFQFRSITWRSRSKNERVPHSRPV